MSNFPPPQHHSANDENVFCVWYKLFLFTLRTRLPVIPENFGAAAEKFIWNPCRNTLSVKLLKKIKKTFLVFSQHF